jgi:hypothetical protein
VIFRGAVLSKAGLSFGGAAIDRKEGVVGSLIDVDRLPSALLAGKVGSVAARGATDLMECAAQYPSLFPERPFDPSLFSLVAMANASCAPWLDADRLQMANRASLWAFGVDWLIDYLAKSAAEVRDIVERCVAVVDGSGPRPGDPITEFLAEIHAALVAAPAYPELAGVWRAEFVLMLEAMAREWDWRAAPRGPEASALPSLADYLENADNICFSWVFVSHWIFASDPPVEHVDEIRAAGRKVQLVIRLLNDLGTYERDVNWGDGDLNVLMLGLSRDDVLRLSADLARDARESLTPLRATEPELTEFLDRYIGFNSGFYGVTDYWGKL